MSEVRNIEGAVANGGHDTFLAVLIFRGVRSANGRFEGRLFALVKFIKVCVDSKVFGSDRNELIDVFGFPFRIKFAKFKVSTNIKKSRTQATDEVVVDDVVVDSKAILL